MKPMMFSKAGETAETKAEPKRLERRWVKQNGHLECYWYVAGEPTITAYAITMAAG